MTACRGFLIEFIASLEEYPHRVTVFQMIPLLMTRFRSSTGDVASEDAELATDELSEYSIDSEK